MSGCFESSAVLHSVGFNHWYMFSSPAIAGGMLYFGLTQGKLVAVDLAGFKPARTFETEEIKEHKAAYTKGDGTPNGEALFRSDFYDDMVAGVDRTISM